MRHGGNLRHMECTRDKGADLLKDKIKLKKGEGDERRAPPLEMGGLLETSGTAGIEQRQRRNVTEMFM